VIYGSAQSCAAWAEGTDPDAAFREEFLGLLARLELEPALAIALAEAVTGREFETCIPTELVPVLQQLLDLLRSHRSPIDARQLCEA